MTVSRLSASRPHGVLVDSAASAEGYVRLSGVSTPPGQVFADLLLLGALACQAPVAVLSVPQTGGGWSTLSHGFDTRDGLNDPLLLDAIAGSGGPVEFVDLVTSLPKSPLVLPPHSMRWAYGVALRDGSGSVVGVVAVMDRWLRQLTKREQRAMAALARQLTGHLSQLRRPQDAGDEPRPVLRGVPQPAPAPPPSRSRGSHSPETPQLLRSHEVASIFDVTERTVINWAAAGKLPSLRTIGGHLRFRREDVMKLLSGAEDSSFR
jgi:excisionase family DNA binding protein